MTKEEVEKEVAMAYRMGIITGTVAYVVDKDNNSFRAATLDEITEVENEIRKGNVTELEG